MDIEEWEGCRRKERKKDPWRGGEVKRRKWILIASLSAKFYILKKGFGFGREVTRWWKGVSCREKGEVL